MPSPTIKRSACLVTDLAGQPLQDLTDYDGRVSFLLSPDDRQLAYVATDAEMEASTLGPLYVVDVETRRTRELSDRPVLAFYWSPDGQKLAFLTLDTVNGTDWVALECVGWQGHAPVRRVFPVARTAAELPAVF